MRRELGRNATNAELAEKLEWTEQRTEQIGRLVDDARRRHDEELLDYLDPVDPQAPEDASGRSEDGGA
jgi:hypothetical protein